MIGQKNQPEPDDSEDAAGQHDKVAEVVAKWHTCENGERSVKLYQVSSAQLFSKDTTHRSTHSAIDGNDDTHDSVAKDTGADCHFPAEADSDNGRSCAIKVSEPPLSLAQVSTDESAGDSPTSQFETAQASAIQ